MLVVDDEPLPRTLLSVSLREAGYRVVEAVGGKAALAILREQPVDVVLLDLVMPEMDGFQVLRRMKADDLLEDIPVVVVSASDDMNSVVRCIEMGAIDHISKPFDPVLLQVRIRSALAIRRLDGSDLPMATGSGPAPVREGIGQSRGMRMTSRSRGWRYQGFSRPYSGGASHTESKRSCSLL